MTRSRRLHSSRTRPGHRPRKPAGRSSLGRPPANRDPALVLYQRSRELLEASNRLRAAARVDGSAPGLAGAIACLHAAVDTMAGAVADMQGQVEPTPVGRGAVLERVVWAARARRLARSLDALAHELELAGAAARRARMDAQPVVTRMRAA